MFIYMKSVNRDGGVKKILGRKIGSGCCSSDRFTNIFPSKIASENQTGSRKSAVLLIMEYVL